MLIKFETKSNRVKGLAFHPKRPWILASLHNGSIQLWDYRTHTLLDQYDEHEGPVRAVDFHKTQPLFVSGGDDYKIKVWNYKLRRCLFTLTGHLDYIRTVQFHHEQPWILSASDDQTIRIWNWQSRTLLTVLSGHNHYVMCAQFHPKDDLIVSASLDQTVRVWDISGLKKKNVVGDDILKMSQLNQDLFGTNDVMVKYLLEGHERGVNWAQFHPTLPLIVSAADDRQVKIWRYSETRAWEVETLRGHINNVSCAVFHPKKDLVISNSEDRTIRVWDFNNNKFLYNYRKEHDRFWILAVHPTQNLIAAGHDSGLMVFKFERERPAFHVIKNELYYFREKYIKKYNLETNSDNPLGLFRRSSSQIPKDLQFNITENYVLLVTDSGWELHKVPKSIDEVEYCKSIKQDYGIAAVWIDSKKFAVLDKNRMIVVRNVMNESVKEISPPVSPVDSIFRATPGRILLRTEEKMYLYDFEQQAVLCEIPASGVKYVVWSDDLSRAAFISKHTIVIVSKNSKGLLEPSCSIHETIRIKSGAFDENGVFIYTTLNHMKYCLPNGDSGTIKTLDVPIYIAKVKGNAIHFMDREGIVNLTYIDATEYKFKLALFKGQTHEVKKIMSKSKILGDSIIAYLQQKGHPEVALKFVKDDAIKFNLALECGNIEIAKTMAHKMNNPECWERLAAEALKQGDLETVEKAYQPIRAYEKLSFLYLVSGQIDKLQRMLKIAELRNDVMSRFQNALFLGDVEERIKVLEAAGQTHLAYITAKTYGLDKIAEEIQKKLDPNIQLPEVIPDAKLLYPPTPICKETQWPLLAKREETKFLDEEEEDTQEISIPSGAWGEKIEITKEDEEIYEEKKEEEEEGELKLGGGWSDLSNEFKDELSKQSTTSTEYIPPSVGRNIMDYWPDNSQLAVDHIAAGSFLSAMQILNRTVGIINFEPLKEHFMSVYMASRAILPIAPLLPSMQFPLQRTISGENNEDKKHISLPAVASYTLSELEKKYKEGLKATTDGHFEKAQGIFLHIIHSILFTVVEKKKDANTIKELLSKCTEYCVAIRLELQRKATKDPKRSCELAAYFTHCSKLANIHIMLSLLSAMSVCYKNQNYKTAAGFAARLRRMSPPQQMADQAHQVMKKAEEKPTDKYTLDYDERNPFVICAYSLTPIYAGSESVKCSYCDATYKPEYRGKLCVICNLGTIGNTNVTGLQLVHRKK